MKILIFTVSAGEGHNSMSRAVRDYIGGAYPDAEVRIYDLFKDGEQTKRKKRAVWLVNDGYFKLVKYAIGIANRQYERLKRRSAEKPAKTLRKNFIAPARKGVKEIMDAFRPDSVFCAHTYAGILMADLRREGNESAMRARIATVVSDYDVAPYTELLTGLDYIITPTDDFDGVLLESGFDLSKRRSYGIPVQRKFSQYMEKSEALRTLGLKEGKKTLMIMSGSIGFGNIAKTILNFNKCRSDFRILCVCARNKKLKEKLEKLQARGRLKKEIHIFGYVNNVEVLMSASDVLLGKIGGVAIAEAFNKYLPIIADKKLPFQEYDNMVFLRARNACDYISCKRKAYLVADRFFGDEARLVAMLKEIEVLRRPDASKDIGDLICHERA